MMMFKNKTALVFGGSGAIGRAVGQAFGREGAHVHLGARGQDRLEEAAQDIRAAGGTAETLLVDTLDEQATINAVAQLAGRTGGIDIVVIATSFMHD
jgi:3-oxoacyl-[acyl-carrier protein] reductase